MDGSLLPGWGLRHVEVSDAAVLNAYFATLAEPLSDYTFSQIFTWRNSLRLLWREMHGHLCVFANGAGDLTLLLPPIGYGDAPRALSAAFELMDDYNAQHHVPDRSRVEYASEELLTRLDPTRSRLRAESMGHDYVYDAARMIDLAGGDLASKRQAKNRFVRNFGHRVETYDAARHLPACLDLLGSWNEHQTEHHAAAPTTSAIKRQKELLATELALKHAGELGLAGMVVHVAGDDGVERLGGFTLGERLGKDQSSIVIEKTDLRVKGLAQFIFSEFVRQHWSDRPLVNVGDDWGLPTLAWTKQSYRPMKLLKKFILRQERSAMSATGFAPATITVRTARTDDVAAAARLERTCFDAYQLDAARLDYLHRTPRAVFRVAEREGTVVGHAISIVRHTLQGGVSGRLYSIAVDPACRGYGIGRQLLADAKAQLAARGVKRVYLEVERSNTAAVELYARNGFRTIDVLPAFYGPNRDGVRMGCDLAADALRPAA